MSTQRKALLKKLIVDRMNLRIEPSSIGDTQPIFGSAADSLALDSIDALDLVVAIFEQFSVEIQDTDMHIFANVQSIDDFIESKIAVEQV